MEHNTYNNPNPNPSLTVNSTPTLTYQHFPPVIFSSTEHPSQVNFAEWKYLNCNCGHSIGLQASLLAENHVMLSEWLVSWQDETILMAWYDTFNVYYCDRNFFCIVYIIHCICLFLDVLILVFIATNVRLTRRK